MKKKWKLTALRNAELKEYIVSGVSKDEFMTRMKAALLAAPPPPSPPSPAQPAPAPTEPLAISTAPASQPSSAVESSTSSSAQATSASSTNSRVQAILAERAARLAEKKIKDEEDAKRQRAEKAKANAEAEASGLRKPDAQSKHAEALKKKQREAREERQRILKAIEDDKAARKAQKAEAESVRRASMASEKPDLATFAPASRPLPSTGKPSEHCALQVRLFDGSTIRHRFSSNDTLKDVRKWVDDTREDGKERYVFKVLLTPLPSRTIDISDEDKSLHKLELAPSSTLILLRAPKYTAASSSSARPVAGEPQGSAFQRLIAYILAIVTGILGSVTSFFSALLSTTSPPTAPAGSEATSSQTSQSQAAADAARRRGRIAGMDHADQRRNEQQFYNGNSVSCELVSASRQGANHFQTNFEPRTDDGE